jgi:hypothetical protein
MDTTRSKLSVLAAGGTLVLCICTGCECLSGTQIFGQTKEEREKEERQMLESYANQESGAFLKQ